MSFAERTKNPPRNLCAVGRVLDQLPPDERGALEAMLADKETWPHEGIDSIKAALEDEGYGHVGVDSIRRHRHHNGCRRCDKP